MFKALPVSILLALLPLAGGAQVIYSETFSGQTLATYTSATTSSFNYSTVPSGFTLLNDNVKNISTEYNKPFNIPALLRQGWALFNPSTVNDTFLVATSWFDTTTATTASRWIVSPVISGISASSALTWTARSGDPNFREGYEVYVTTNTAATPSPTLFTVADRVFSLADNIGGGLGEESNWTTRGASLGSYAGQSVRFAFRLTSQDKFQLWIDDLKIENLPNALDASITAASYDRYVSLNAGTTPTISITNLGHNTIGSMVLGYKVGTNPVVYQAFGLSQPLGPASTQTLSFSTPLILQSASYNTAKFFISTINSSADQAPANDTLASFITGTTQTDKKVQVKQFTGTDYGWGPDAYLKSRDIVMADTNVLFVNFHDNDNMSTSEGDQVIADYAPLFPSAVINGVYWSDLASATVDRTLMQARIARERLKAAPLKLSVLNKTYNTGTRELSFDVKVETTAELKGDLRMHTYLTENNVCGPFNDNSINGWNQLSLMHDIPGSPYYNVGAYNDGITYILNPNEFKHDQVLIKALDGAAGSNTLIPAAVSVGQSFTATYTYTLPAAFANGNIYNADNVYITASIEQYTPDLSQRYILNTNRSKLTANAEQIPVGIHEASAAAPVMGIYPNPAASEVTLYYHQAGKTDSHIRILNHMGALVYEATLPAAEEQLRIGLSDFAAGVYVVMVDSGLSSTSRKLIVTK